MSIHLQREIDNIKKKLLSLGALVEDMLRRSVDSIWRTTESIVQELVSLDSQVDMMEVEIEEDCLKILALHQPVAIDLRFIIAVLKINNDLERIGDLAINIILQTRHLNTDDKDLIDFDFKLMAAKAQSMLKKSLDALVNMDTAAAREVMIADDDVDDMHRRMYSRINDYLAGAEEPKGTIINLFQISRNLERVADQATNIAEDVVYMIDGKIVRHRLNLDSPSQDDKVGS